MLDLRLFRDRRFSVASGGIALTYFAMFGTFFLSAQFLQLVLGLSRPRGRAAAAARCRPMMLLVAPRVPRVVARYGVGPRRAPSASVSSPLGLVGARRCSAPTATRSTVWLAIIPMAFGVAVDRRAPDDRADVGRARRAGPGSARR